MKHCESARPHVRSVSRTNGGELNQQLAGTCPLAPALAPTRRAQIPLRLVDFTEKKPSPENHARITCAGRLRRKTTAKESRENGASRLN